MSDDTDDDRKQRDEAPSDHGDRAKGRGRDKEASPDDERDDDDDGDDYFFFYD